MTFIYIIHAWCDRLLECNARNGKDRDPTSSPSSWLDPSSIRSLLPLIADMKIRRGCTDDIDINMFMVDHVCMSEGGGKGKMCFCEENECNAATTTNANANNLATAILSAAVAAAVAENRRRAAPW